MAARRIFSVLWWWEPYSYAASHTYHHRYTQFVHADRENVFPLEPSLDPWVLLEMFTVSLTGKPGRVFGKGGLISAVQLTIKGACGGIPGVPGTHRSAPLTAYLPSQTRELLFCTACLSPCALHSSFF